MKLLKKYEWAIIFVMAFMGFIIVQMELGFTAAFGIVLLIWSANMQNVRSANDINEAAEIKHLIKFH